MLSKLYKTAFVLSAVIIVILGFILSCDTLFSNNMGGKVDVEPPTITVLSPAAGAYIKGVTKFEGRATAYRDLRSVEVRILSSEQGKENVALMDWTSSGITLAGSANNKTWVYTMDTHEFAAQHGLDDGFLKVQFRASDPSHTADAGGSPTETVVMVYIVKNNPSIVKLTSPDHDKLNSPDNESDPALVVTNMEIRGQIVDRRGIKPGYPMIKFWPDSMPEPEGDDTDWGWAVLFLSGVDDLEQGTGWYADRTSMRVENARSFVFKLSEYTIDRVTRHIAYDLSSGDYKPLPPDLYRFRIVTSDTYFDSVVNSPEFMYPRDPADGEVEAVGYYPIETGSAAGLWDSGQSYLVQLTSSGVFPTVELEYSVPQAELNAVPNIYITESTARKIAVGKTGRPDFMLQILTSHLDGIKRAQLRYEHTGAVRRTGDLIWDNDLPNSDGYVDGTDDESKAGEGHKGALKNPADAAEGRYFRFTADGSLKDSGGNPIFVTSTEPYTLIATVYAADPSLYTEYRVTLYMDGDGPSVSMRSVMGAAKEPLDSGAIVLGGSGTINDDSYTVNGNIQVSVDRSANQGIASAKWMVEETNPGTFAAPAAGSTLEKLIAYKDNPTAAGLAFYTAIAEGPASGLIKAPASTGLDMDRMHNFKFNTRKELTDGTATWNDWNGKDLWLYIIAQDGVQNLSFVLQKLHVDDDSDKPEFDIPGITSVADGGIASRDQLYYVLGATPSGNVGRSNVLDAQGIDLSFADDDGIKLDDQNIVIILKNLDDGKTVTFTTAQMAEFLGGQRYLLEGNYRQLTGVLSQKMMADALYPAQNLTKLPDGAYSLSIDVTDNLTVKTAITPATRPGDAPEPQNLEQNFFFAVRSRTAQITIDTPADNASLNKDPVTIKGTVTSGMKIQRLEIVFDPDVISSTPHYNAASPVQVLTLYKDAACTTPVAVLGDTAWDSGAGSYVYYWQIQNVKFGREDLFTGAPSNAIFDWRAFSLTAWDGLGYSGGAQRSIEVDVTPPVVNLDLFNFGRPEMDAVNGKVPVEISVNELNGVQVDRVNTDGTDDPGDLMYVKWWVVRAGTPGFDPDPAVSFPLGWNTPFPTGANGAGGQMTRADSIRLGGGRYLAIFDTSGFVEGEKYLLYAMAEDIAGNTNGVELLMKRPNGSADPFTIKQDSDYPVLDLNELSPYNGNTEKNLGKQLLIKGVISDDDGFGAAGAASGKYVEIQFPADPDLVGTHPPASITWGAWQHVTGCTIDPSTGGLSFGHDTASDAYFAAEGWKYYRLRLTDEAESGPWNPPGDPYGTPNGKNPDGVPTIAAVSKEYPTTGYYFFLLKNYPPQVYFTGLANGHTTDPDYRHDADYRAYVSQFVIDNTFPNGLGFATAAEATDAADAEFRDVEWKKPPRPAFNNLTALKNTLTGYIKEATSITEAYFYVGNERKGDIKTMLTRGTTSDTLDQYTWNLTDPVWNTWLSGFVFDGNHDGIYSVAFEAADEAGNKSRVEWTFYIDSTPPSMTFTNVSPDEERIVSGRSGQDVFIRGRFSDTYSNIGQTFHYQFDSLPLQNDVDIEASGGTHSGKIAQWQALVPNTLGDGPHTLTIIAYDMAGNESDPPQEVHFILDRNPAVVSAPDNMLVSQNLLVSSLEDYERVFSAAKAHITSTTKAFTLSGVAYDRYLSGLTASFFPGGGALAIAGPEITFDNTNGSTWSNSADSLNGIPAGQLRVRKAVASDLIANGGGYAFITNDGSINDPSYLYVWELDILEKDMYAILYAPPASITPPDLDDGRVRRQVTVTAQDSAGHNSEMQNWRFYLDDEEPVVEFINAQTGVAVPARMDDLGLEGIASDGTNIKEIRYFISKWNYTAGTPDYFYYNNGTAQWNLAAKPPAYTQPGNWPRLYDGSANPQSTVYWTLNNAALASSGGAFPTTLPEGRYKVELWVTDYSISATPANAGNPANTVVEFFIDKADPVITWVTAQKDFYKPSDLTFEIKAADANTIAAITAEVFAYGTSSPAIGSVSVTPYPLPANALTVDDAAVAVTGLSDGHYVLVLTVTDGTGRSASIGNTLAFIQDNVAPGIDVNPAGGNAAVTGRVQLRGNFTKDNAKSPVSRIAYWVAPHTSAGADAGTNFGIPSHYSGAATGTLLSPANLGDSAARDAYLTTNGWHYYSGNDGGNYQLKNGDTVLMEMQDGLTTSNILIPNVRNFLTAPATYLSDVQTAPAGVTFNTHDISGFDDKDVYKFVVYFLAIDEAGNNKVERREFWFYPAGDFPGVTITNPSESEVETKRLMNGRIRISGSATDNVRVKYVWFRVLDGDTDQPLTGIRIPEWDEFWSAKTSLQNLSGYRINESDHWYMANGGNSTNVSWWAYINTEGELDPLGSDSRKIKIEVMAEDTTWNDYYGATGGYDPSNGLFSSSKKVTAFVVRDAPEFAGAEARTWDEAGSSFTPNPWGSITDTYLRRRSSYKIAIRHDAGVSSITWMPTIATVNNLGTSTERVTFAGDTANAVDLLDPAHPYNTGTYQTNLDGISDPSGLSSSSGPGIAVKAGPKTVLTGSVTLNAAKTYLVWKWDDALVTSGVFVSTDVIGEMRFAIITGKSGPFSIGGAELMEQVELDGQRYFEWEVEIDIHADILPVVGAPAGYFDDKAMVYPVYLSATENSRTVPLTTSTVADLPIDNSPPQAMYTHTPYVAGTAATIGGEAGDLGAVGGLSRVILWFSRKEVATDPASEKSFIWNNSHITGTDIYDSFNGSGAFTAGTNPVEIPAEYASTATSGNYSSVVIDRNDPRGQTAHNGHLLPTGFATVGGDLGTSWYVTLDSTKMESGRITVHYIVYDKAGNSTYYSQRLVVMNGVPRIHSITLATDIRGDTGMAAALGSGNRMYSAPTTGSGSTNATLANSPVAMIRTQFETAVSSADTDTEKGISRAIPINTDMYGNYGVIYEDAFTARNSLLAFQVNLSDTIDEAPQTWTKTRRTFRVEYVSGAEPLAGGDDFYKGIKAGRMYMINKPGSTVNRFPWASFGARIREDGYATEGLVFMALEDGIDVNVPDLDYTFGGAAAPSAWELNSSYYSTNPATPLTRTVPGSLPFTGATNGDLVITGTAGESGGYSAGFVYGTSAFGTAAGTTIIDFDPATGNRFGPDKRPLAYPNINASFANPWKAHSLFIIRVFDGDEAELFGDFAMLAIRVNNDDQTPPYAQLYDLNPKTEWHESELADATPGEKKQAALKPEYMGENRTRGGLWNEGTVQLVEKSGHIEPRRIPNNAAGTSWTHTLTSAEMGGAANESRATMDKPFVNAANMGAFFEYDTVSGKVILRGYAEDDQRIHRIDLEFWNEANTGSAIDNVTILQHRAPSSGSNFGAFLVPGTNLRGGAVDFTETVDMNRHRVEWAYLWDTEIVPQTTKGTTTNNTSYIVGNYTVRAVAYNANNAAPKAPKTPSTQIPHIRNYISSTAYSNTWDYYNPDFPVFDSRFGITASNDPKFQRYNSVRVNVWPYITGFERNKADFSHNIRSRQGRYIFSRGEIPVIKGFNLGGGSLDAASTTISLPSAANRPTTAVNASQAADYGFDSGFDAALDAPRYRILNAAVPTTAVTGNGLVTLAVTRNSIAYPAVNTDASRQQSFTVTTPITAGSTTNVTTTHYRPVTIQPWNTERSPGMDGSDLWDDFALVHIWQANGTNTNAANAGYFSRNRANQVTKDPTMAINPLNGILWSSHSEAGGNTGEINVRSITGLTSATNGIVAAFCDPIITSDIFISTRTSASTNVNGTIWSAYSIIGEAGGTNTWAGKGGMYITGPGGGDAGLTSGVGAADANQTNTNIRAQYIGESTHYNANAAAPGTQADPPTFNQFLNPHIVSHYGPLDTGTAEYEHIHVSYYDTKDGSIKYRYNRRGTPGVVNGFGNATTTNGSPYAWTNLDGGFDADDQVQMTGTGYNNGSLAAPFTSVAANNRIVNYTTRDGIAVANRPDVGEYNAIAVNRNGYPVVAYYDKTNQKLKMAVSTSRVPVAASAWKIRDNVIPTTDLSHTGTGQYVSMKIDTRGTTDIVHIAALNSLNRNLVYIRGELNPSAAEVLSNVTVQVVDSVGSVGSWCSLSLDAQGNPWIAYKDESYRGSRDGVKMAFLNKDIFYKGKGNAIYAPGNNDDVDMFSASIAGWEALNVPTQFRVEDATQSVNTRVSMECFPARNVVPTNITTQTEYNNWLWSGAVGYLAPDYYRVAYYVK